MRASILGIGQVSACGAGIEPLRRALTGALPEPSSVDFVSGGRRASFPALQADPGDWKEIVPAREARRLDPFSRNALVCAALARRDSGLAPSDPGRTGVVAATGHGPVRTTFSLLDRIIARGDEFMSPMEFSVSVHSAPATTIASHMGLRGPCMTVTGFAGAWPSALGVALGWLSDGTVEEALVLACDEVHEVMAYAQSRRGASPHDRASMPGETYAAFLLGHGRGRHGTIHAPTADTRRDAGGAAVSSELLSRIWGSSPTCDALAAAAAVLCLEDGRLYPDGGAFPDLVEIEVHAGAGPETRPIATIGREPA